VQSSTRNHNAVAANKPALSEVESALSRRNANGGSPSRALRATKIDIMEIKLTAVFRKFPEGYAAFVEELPGANTQGKTLEEARENLKEAA
jgi:hypothetical protein